MGMATVRTSLEGCRLISWVERALALHEFVSTLDILGTTRTFFLSRFCLFPRSKLYTPTGSSCWRWSHWRAEFGLVFWLSVNT